MLGDAYLRSLDEIKAGGRNTVLAASSALDGENLSAIRQFEDAARVVAALGRLESADGFDGAVYVVRPDGDTWRILSTREAEFNRKYDMRGFDPVTRGGRTVVAGPESQAGGLWLRSAAPLRDAGGVIGGMLVVDQRVDAWRKRWFDRAVLAVLCAIFGFAFLLVAILQINRWTRRKLEDEQLKDGRLQMVEQEKEDLFGVARKVQRGMMPKGIPEVGGLRVEVRTSLRRVLEGDYFDFYSYGGKALGVLLSECKGNESSIALADLLLQREVLTLVHDECTPGKMLETANDRISEIMQREFLASALFMTLNPKMKMLQYAGAGHPAPIHIPAGGGELQQLELSPKMLGCGGHVEIQDRTAAFNAGDRFILYSDGPLKAVKNNGGGLQPFGLPRFQETILANREKPLSELLDKLLEASVQWAGGEDQLTDDLTIIGIEIK